MRRSDGAPDRHCPDRGDIVSLDFTPTKGHEQDGRRPAVVLSPRRYNARAGLCVVAPITRTVRGYPFEIPLPASLPVVGVALADQVSSGSWVERDARLLCRVPDAFVDRVASTFRMLLP